MSCLECSRRETTVIHEQANLRKYAKYLTRLKYGPTPRQLAELDKVKGQVANAERFLDEHRAECECLVTQPRVR